MVPSIICRRAKIGPTRDQLIKVYVGSIAMSVCICEWGIRGGVVDVDFAVSLLVNVAGVDGLK